MINLNMIAERRARKTREISILRGTALGVVLLFIAAVGINIATYYVHGEVASENASWQKNLDDLQDDEKSYQQLLADLQELRPVVGVLERVRLTEAAWMIILADLGRIMPPGASIGGVGVSTGAKGVTLSLNGTAPEPKVVGDFMVALHEDTGWAGDPTLGNVGVATKNGVSTVSFSLTVPVHGMFGGDL